jgi:hypothetical protein
MIGAAGDKIGAAGMPTGAAGWSTMAAAGMTDAASGKIGAACSWQLAGRLAKLFSKSGVLSDLLDLLLSDVEMSVLFAALLPLLPSRSR